MRKLNKGSVYMVFWVDTFQMFDGWHEISEVADEAKKQSEYIKTVGFYLGSFSGFEVFAAEFNTHTGMKDWAGITYIPQGCIRKVDKLV